ncbi:MAG: hypothetical protein Ct9H300mP32_2370 [Verrucomicrobiota bacterium]|nr:MAG: hypothetical protein Ct9H300mP32_2370 [Verrucomicrobiota bacterium]
MPPGQRSELLHHLARRIRDNVESIAQLETRNVGKPISDARWEADAGAKVFEYYAGAIGHLCGQTTPGGEGRIRFHAAPANGRHRRHHAGGISLSSSPAGRSPQRSPLVTRLCSSQRRSPPLTALLLGQLAQEAGLPDGVLQVVPGAGSEAGNALATHPLVRKIGFTGSTEIGAKIMKLAANDFKRVSLKLGGKSPNIVFPDANWQRAPDESPMSVFANTGQDCCARSRMFVEQSIFDDFVNPNSSPPPRRSSLGRPDPR